MRSNYSRSVCETQNSMTINIHDVCNGIYTIIPCLCPCLGDARQPALLCEYLYVSIINLFSLWRLRRERAATRRQQKRVRCNILYCSGSGGTICWLFCITVRHHHYRRLYFHFSFFSRPGCTAQIRFHFIRLLDALSPVANTFFPLFSPYFTIIWHLSSVKSTRTSGI